MAYNFLAPRFRVAHPKSDMGDFDWAYANGYDLVAIQPDGLLVYRRAPWLRRLFRKHH